MAAGRRGGSADRPRRGPSRPRGVFNASFPAGAWIAPAVPRGNEVPVPGGRRGNPAAGSVFARPAKWRNLLERGISPGCVRRERWHNGGHDAAPQSSRAAGPDGAGPRRGAGPVRRRSPGRIDPVRFAERPRPRGVGGSQTHGPRELGLVIRLGWRRGRRPAATGGRPCGPAAVRGPFRSARDGGPADSPRPESGTCSIS